MPAGQPQMSQFAKPHWQPTYMQPQYGHGAMEPGASQASPDFGQSQSYEYEQNYDK